MANAYDVMRMAKQKGAQRIAEEDWINYLDKLGKWEERAGWADMGSQAWSIFGPDIGGGGGFTGGEVAKGGRGGMYKDGQWIGSAKEPFISMPKIMDFFTGGGIPGFAIKQIGSTILKNLIMGGKKQPKFVSSDPSNPYSGKATRPYKMKAQIQSDEASRTLDQMSQESILTNLLLSGILGGGKGMGDMNIADFFGIGGRRR